MTTLVTVQGVLRRLAEAVPVAWREDRVFRYAAIGAGITLAVLLIRPSVSRHDVQLLPLATLPGAGMPAVLSPPGQASLRTPMPPPEVPKIAPGRPLGATTITPAPDGDHFGTVRPGTR